MPSLSELTTEASEAQEPGFPPKPKVKFGGIDPLGLRQINFDLMDLVLPGVNNVARHIRPFTVATWAWRRAGVAAAAQGKKQLSVEMLQDFVARIEVIYVWSQFLLDRNSDLPGHDVFGALLQSDKYVFDGSEWADRREIRRNSTAISSPINYGPALKTLRWVVPHETLAGVMRANSETGTALDAFERKFRERLDHPAFNKFGRVSVSTNEARSWAEAWHLEDVTPQEKTFMRIALCGCEAPKARQAGVALLRATVESKTDSSPDEVRHAMCGSPSTQLSEEDRVTAKVWKQVQLRQLFRLTLEALFFWLRKVLSDGPLGTAELIDLLWDRACPDSKARDTTSWLAECKTGDDPVAHIESLNHLLSNAKDAGLESTIISAIALTIQENFQGLDPNEREDRLPLDRAQREARAWGNSPPKDFLRHILESWVLAQHVYWSVGRGLADARARGKSILRLKIVLEDNGWTLTPGSKLGNPPLPAGDRLETVMSLAKESDLI